MRKSALELNSLLRQAEQQVSIGGHYAHYKDPTHVYEVTGLVINEADDSVYVIYRPRYDELMQRIQFSRPLTSWLETVQADGESRPRFLLLDH